MTAGATVFTALLTPLGANARIDRSAAYAHITHLAAAGVDALWACGSCGEGPILSDDCVVDAGAWLMHEFGDSLTVTMNAGRASTSGTLQLALRLADVGVKHIAAVCPYYYSLSADQLVGHFESLLAALPRINIYAYNIPPRTVNDLLPEQVGQLAQRGLAGIKDTTDSWERHCQYLDLAKSSSGAFRVFIGSDALVGPALLHGSEGVRIWPLEHQTRLARGH